MHALEDNKEATVKIANDLDDSIARELISKLFPEKAEIDRLKSLEDKNSAGEIKAHIAIHQLFNTQ